MYNYKRTLYKHTPIYVCTINPYTGLHAHYVHNPIKYVFNGVMYIVGVESGIGADYVHTLRYRAYTYIAVLGICFFLCTYI